jgi:hypothetical protein
MASSTEKNKMSGKRIRKEPKNNGSGTSRHENAAKTMFGLLMILIYIGLGILFLFNFFGWPDNWNLARISLGILFVVYGVWRCYRQFFN